MVAQPRAALASALLLLALTAPARATFVRAVMDRADTESLFDSEYFADLRGFAVPRSWTDTWAASTSGYRINGASLDCCALYLDQELKFARRLTPRLEFRFRFTDLDDKDRQEQHHWLELETDLGAGFSLEAFGEPAYRKEDADIGLGLRWRRGGGQLRVRRNMVDFNFNSRGSTTERYSLKPYTDELHLEAPAGAWRAWAGLELDEPTRREIPAENRSFGYTRTRALLGAGSDEGIAPRLVYSLETQRKVNRFATVAAGESQDARRQVHAFESSARLRPRDGDELEPGLAYLNRSARTDRPEVPAGGTTYRRWELQPWLRWRRRWTKIATGELAAFLSFGENRTFRSPGATPSAHETLVEAKIGTGVDFLFSPSARLGLYGTFDADAPGHFWDGGNVRAMFLF
ncbi:MAG: hypothetical protein HY923_11155 [Elusimicrobia bacterium]|nr:hypothetical protein [Elusimicrobiota bacterium]